MKKLSKWMRVALALVLAVALVIPTTAYAAEEKSVDIYVDELFLYIGEQRNLGYDVLNGEATSEDWEATWKSGDANVLTCEENGHFEAVAAGTTTLTVTTKSGLTDTIPVTVLAPLKWNGEKTEKVIFNNRFSQRQFELTVDETGEYALSIKAEFSLDGYIVDDEENHVGGFGGYNPEGYIYLETGVTYSLYLYGYQTFGSADVTLSKWTEDTSVEEEEGDDENDDVIFAEESITISVGDRVYLPALVGTGEDATFVSSDAQYVSIEDVTREVWNDVTEDYDDVVVEEDVIAMGANEGTATITATTASGTDTLVVNVEKPEVVTFGEEFTVELGDGFLGKTYAVNVTDALGYGFMSSTDDEDMYGILYDQAGEIIAENDDRSYSVEEDYNFEIREYLSAGTYYLYVTTYGANAGYETDFDSFESKVIVDKEAPATGVEIVLGTWNYVVEDGGVYYILPGWGDSMELSFVGGTFAAAEEVTFTSDNEDVVSIDEYGDWYTKEVGTAVVTVTTKSGLKDSVTFKVVDEIVAGDMNLDGVIGSADINLILGVINGTVEMKDIYYQAEVNGDNKIDVNDIAALVTSAELIKNPTKTTYTVGESFDTTGMELKVTFVDGNVETVTDGFIVSGYDATKEGTQKVTISYGNETFPFEVTVVKASPATGDATTYAWAIVMVLCAGYVVLTYKKRRNS